MCSFLVLATHEFIVDRKVAIRHATSIGVKLSEHRDVQVEPTVVALVHHSSHCFGPCRPVGHLLDETHHAMLGMC